MTMTQESVAYMSDLIVTLEESLPDLTECSLSSPEEEVTSVL